MKHVIVTMVLSALYLFSIQAFAADAEAAAKSDVIKKISPYSVSKTMDKFEAIVKKKGFGVFARVDHKKNAQSVDMDMNEAQLLIFGNPKGGTVLMKQDIGVALDLPLRVAVYKGADGKVYIAYHDPMALLDTYQLEGNKVIPTVTAGLDKLTSATVAPEK